MIETIHVIALAVVLLQLYIALCTYWIFKKIDRYEGIAVRIIERYLQHSQAIMHGSSSVLMQINGIELDKHTEIDENARHKCEKIAVHIQKIIKYVPKQLHPKINHILESWYSQLCIDIFCFCV